MLSDARRALEALTGLLAGYSTDAEYQAEAQRRAKAWDDEVVASFHSGYGARTGVLAQAEVLGAVDEAMDARDVVVCAAGSLPGDLHGMWRTRDRKGYHVEYGYSCMGYEIPGGIGIALAAPDRDVFVTVGDGSYLMMPTELVTAVQEGIKVIVVLLQNHGYASIGSLAESLGVQRFGTKYRYRNRESGRLDGGILPVDLAANAASLGREGAEGVDPGGAQGRPGEGQGVGNRRPGARGHRPGVPVARWRRLVGRPGGRGVGPGLHQGGARDLQRIQGHPTAVPVTGGARAGQLVDFPAPDSVCP